MKTRIIDGKKYIEYDEHKVSRNSMIRNTIFLFLLALSIILLFITIITVIQNREMLQSRPIDYVMDKYNFVSCSCFDAGGTRYQSGFNSIEVEGVIR